MAKGFEKGQLQVDLTDSPSLVVIPAQAGIQYSSSVSWIPVFTGMTITMSKGLDSYDQPKVWLTISQNFA
jgi:hypothetical protein